MNPVLAIWKKDLRSILGQPTFYLLTGLCLLLWGVFFIFQLFTFVKQSEQFSIQGVEVGLNIHQNLVSSYIVIVHYVLLFILAAFSLRFFAEEKKMKTFPILLTSPMTSWQIVLAKWLTGVSLIALLLIVSAVYPISLGFFVEMPWGLFVLSYLGLFFVLNIYLCAGLLASSVTESLIVCVVLTLVLTISILLLGAGKDLSSSMLWQQVFSYMSIDAHFQFFRKGILNISSLFYFFGLAFFLGLLTERVIEFHRWR